MDFTIIAAMDSQRGIGKNNDLPWHLSKDLKHFKEQTMGGTVIMGRRTWESIPAKYRPFSGRLNIVLTRDPEYKIQTEVLLASSLEEALKQAEGKIFVIGGAHVFAEAIEHPQCTQLMLTEIQSSFECDAYFPEIPARFKKVQVSEPQSEKGIHFRFTTYESKAA